MREVRLIAIVVAAASVAPAFQSIQPPRSPYDRRGLYHVTLHGRFLSPSGDAVEGVHVQLIAGEPQSLPLIDVVTGADGAFSMPDVSSIYPPYMAWFPPDAWLTGGVSVVGESGSSINIGVVHLQPASTIRVSVELVGGPPLAPNHSEPTIILAANNSQFGTRIVAECLGSEWLVRNISFTEGTWEVRFYSGSKVEEYTAAFHGQLGRRDQKFILRLLRDPLTSARHEPVPDTLGAVRLNQSELQGRMEVSETVAPVTNATTDFTMAGRVVGPNGAPIEGAIVSTSDRSIDPAMRQWVSTGREGDFVLVSHAGHCAGPFVSYGDSNDWNLFLSKPSLGNVPCEEWGLMPRKIVMPSPTRLSINVSGVDALKAHADWWHDSFGWQRLSSLHPWIPGRDLWDPWVRVAAEGYLPLVQGLNFPDEELSEKPPGELSMEFTFDPAVRRTLSVRARGAPLSGAIVDVESIVDLASDRRRLLDTYKGVR